MLCINLTSVRDNVPIYLNNKLMAQRIYVGMHDLPSFTNRLVFTANAQSLSALRSKLVDLTDRWLVEELDALERGPAYIVVPFALRVQEEAYTSFRNRANSRAPENSLNLDLGDPSIFIGGKEVPVICAACVKQAVLKGRRCPDYVEGNFACFESSRFALDAMDTFYLTERGELVYNAASVDTTSGEQMEDNTNAGADGAE